METSNGTGILGSISLTVGEIGGDSNDSFLNLLSESILVWSIRDILCLGDLLHLEQDHGADLLGSEFLGLTQVVDLD
jgi:hypothetical protein